VVPLTDEQQVLFEKGKTVYNSLCIACHQPGGIGLDGLAPPLLDSEWVLGKPDIGARIILHGVGGPISVNGTTWRLEMPPLPQLSDEEIAGVLTYTRREWEHNASPVMPADVAKVRAQYKDRTRSWTAEELKPKARAKKTAQAN
jgi:mono/diheme cytochrome c family protein